MLCNHGWEKQQTQRPKGSGPKGQQQIILGKTHFCALKINANA